MLTGWVSPPKLPARGKGSCRRVCRSVVCSQSSGEASSVIVGGGAAGFFGAIHCANSGAAGRVVILEKSGTPLSKVLISGGGRCNLTHNQPEVSLLCEAYPRGQRELRGLFARFGVAEAVDWFEQHGVELKVEADGRMFPTTDNAETVASALRTAAEEAGVEVVLKENVVGVERDEAGQFNVSCASGRLWTARNLLVAPGSARLAQKWAEELGHTTVNQVPSLFTFKIEDPRLKGLAGVSVPYAKVSIKLGGKKGGRGKLVQHGAVLVTHWGVSGPAVLRLSSFAARELHDANYSCTMEVDWMPCRGLSETEKALEKLKRPLGAKRVSGYCPLASCPPVSRGACERGSDASDGAEDRGRFPRRLWTSLVSAAGVPDQRRWCELTKRECRAMAEQLHRGTFAVRGKGAFKDEFVTAGGVTLAELDLRRMESKRVPGLFFAGEVVDVDGITGGFNFQSAWTTGFLAGRAMGRPGH